MTNTNLEQLEKAAKIQNFESAVSKLIQKLIPVRIFAGEEPGHSTLDRSTTIDRNERRVIFRGTHVHTFFTILNAIHTDAMSWGKEDADQLLVLTRGFRNQMESVDAIPLYRDRPGSAPLEFKIKWDYENGFLTVKFRYGGVKVRVALHDGLYALENM